MRDPDASPKQDGICHEPAGGGGPRRPFAGGSGGKFVVSSPIRTTGPLVALIVIFVVFSTTTSTFMNAGNMSLIAQQSVVIGTLALGQTLVILVSGIDLANGAIMVLGTVVAGSYASHGESARRDGARLHRLRRPSAPSTAW